jgi:uncharacterized protein YkwD
MTRAHNRSRSGRAAAGFLLVLALLASGIATDHARAAARHARVERLLALTNDVRVEHGRSALALDARLSRYAKAHSRQMAKEGRLFHSEDLAARLDGLEWTVGGENVGVASSLTDLQEAFLASKPHRRNVLRKAYDHAAVGIVKSDGNLWVTVIFYG